MMKARFLRSFSSLILTLFFLSSPSHASKTHIEGTVTLPAAHKKMITPQGALFIYAKKLGQENMPPLAVKKVANTQFPHSFTLGAEDAMMSGTAFEGPFVIIGKYAPSGDAMEKSGVLMGEHKGKQGQGVKLGGEKLTLELKKIP